MQESRQLRRAELAEGIKRCRHSLYVMKITEDKVSLSMKERIASHIREIEDELRRMEDEFHELNVQQIREELSNG
jgi:hypothetical protein